MSANHTFVSINATKKKFKKKKNTYLPVNFSLAHQNSMESLDAFDISRIKFAQLKLDTEDSDD